MTDSTPIFAARQILILAFNKASQIKLFPGSQEII